MLGVLVYTQFSGNPREDPCEAQGVGHCCKGGGRDLGRQAAGWKARGLMGVLWERTWLILLWVVHCTSTGGPAVKWAWRRLGGLWQEFAGSRSLPTQMINMALYSRMATLE